MSTLLGCLILAGGAAAMVWLLRRPRRPAHDALLNAIAHGHDECVVQLLDRGADRDVRSADGLSPLGLAIAAGHVHIVRILLERGFNPNAAAYKDMPALMVAAGWSRASLVADLVAAGAAPEYCHPVGGSALSVAITKGSQACFEALLRAGVPVGLCGVGGATDLHAAAICGELTMAQELVRRGVDFEACNFHGGAADAQEKKPIDFARENGHMQIVELLEHAPARPRAERTRPAMFAYLLPARQDATLNIVEQIRAQDLKITEVAASSLEAPTLLTAVRSVLPDFDLTFSVDDEPDPRLPVRPVATCLWQYGEEGLYKATPALPPPPDDVVEVVAELARIPYLLRLWSDEARERAERLQESSLADVAAVMVHPPEGPSEMEPWDWWFRVQVAAALILSYQSGRVLEDIADGPADWSNTAAILALFDLARRDEAQRPAVMAKLLQIARRAPTPPAFQHAIQPAALALLALDRDGSLRDEVAAIADPSDEAQPEARA